MNLNCVRGLATHLPIEHLGLYIMEQNAKAARNPNAEFTRDAIDRTLSWAYTKSGSSFWSSTNQRMLSPNPNYPPLGEPQQKLLEEWINDTH